MAGASMTGLVVFNMQQRAEVHVLWKIMLHTLQAIIKIMKDHQAQGQGLIFRDKK